MTPWPINRNRRPQSTGSGSGISLNEEQNESLSKALLRRFMNERLEHEYLGLMSPLLFQLSYGARLALQSGSVFPSAVSEWFQVSAAATLKARL